MAITLTIGLGTSVMGAGNLTDDNLRNDLVYDSSSGYVQLHIPDLTGTGPIVQFSLSTESAFDFTSGHVTTGLDCGLILPAVACGSLSEQMISYDDPTNSGFDGMFELGTILPTGLSPSGVQGFLAEASYRTANISSTTEFDIRVVPEPTSALLVLLGVGIATAFRRRLNRAKK